MKGRFKQCPRCGGTGELTDWKPLPYYDPLMRQYRCRSCKMVFFGLLTEEQLKDVKLQKR